jgi:hypothetical protein
MSLLNGALEFLRRVSTKMPALTGFLKTSREFTFLHFVAKTQKRLSTTRQIVRQRHCGEHREQFGDLSALRIRQTIGAQT